MWPGVFLEYSSLDEVAGVSHYRYHRIDLGACYGAVTLTGATCGTCRNFADLLTRLDMADTG